MKPKKTSSAERIRWSWAALLGATFTPGALPAADTNAPPATAPAPMSQPDMFEGGTNPYNNWIELTTGGFITSGNHAQFQQNQQSTGGPFGGISDFHYQRDLNKTTTLTTDGHALLDQNDYKFNLDVTREKFGFLHFSYNEFRTWYNANGGFYPPGNTFYPLSGDALGLDRGSISFAGGLTLENLPQITFKYTHNFRDGEKGSTIWGDTHPAIGVTQGLSPSFYDINEHSDAFQLDLTDHFKTTDYGAGVRYETGKLNDALKITQSPGEPIQQNITDRQGSGYDLLNGHAFTETWIKKNLLLTTGYSFSYVGGDFSGSRIYGAGFDVGYTPNPGLGYYGMTGDSRLREHVMDLNLLWKPTPHWSIVPSLRVQKQNQDADFSGTETQGANTAPFNGNSIQGDLDVRERLDATFTGVTNWVFNARGEWDEGNGNLNWSGGLVPIGFISFPPVQNQTDNNRLFQKYSLGVKWYPARRVTVNVGAYYKNDHYDYTFPVDASPNNGPADLYPGFLAIQDFQTYDGNARLTWRPVQNFSLSGRYEYQLSTIRTGPDPISGLSQTESSKMNSHIIAADATWSPWYRLNLQAGANYVLSNTRTPVSDYTQAILASENNYWTANVNGGFVVDDKTDLNLGWFYYRADDYNNYSDVGVPYGAGAKEQAVTMSIVRRITQNLRLTLKYGYYHYNDAPSGGNNNYSAHLLLSTLQYRF